MGILGRCAGVSRPPRSYRAFQVGSGLIVASLLAGLVLGTAGQARAGEESGMGSDDVVRAGDVPPDAGDAATPSTDPDPVAQVDPEGGREDVPPLLLDPRPDAHAKSGKPEWTIDPSGSIRWVLVLRHAEKTSETEADPPLTPRGEERAALLRRMLSEAHPTLLLGTELIRTQRTLEPLAAELGLLVDIHESDDPYGMAERVRELDRPVSVVSAHGDTVVPILEALTGLDLQNLHPIAYDDLFVVAIAPGVPGGSGRGAASVLRLQYGEED